MIRIREFLARRAYILNFISLSSLCIENLVTTNLVYLCLYLLCSGSTQASGSSRF
jgi:hypothetical protein